MGDIRKSPNWNPRIRSNGSPHTRGDRRELGRVGIGRAGVLPAQSKKVPSPRFFGAKYRMGPPARPAIKFDNGFLDKFSKRTPTSSDYLALAKWKLKLEAAERLRPDLAEGCAAYRHFLEGHGRKRWFSYEKYVLNDTSGRTTLANAMLDIQDGVEEIWESNKKLTYFSLTGGQISCSGGKNSMFPYPATENWQKAIGGHIIWLSGNVVVTENKGETWFRLDMTLHAEDRYNFNPTQKDIVTGIPDKDNGIFELTSLGKQYDHTSTLKRTIKWKYGTLAKAGSSTATRPWR